MENKNRKGNTNCCVVGCGNTYGNTPVGIHFYSFPNEKKNPERRKRWIAAVKRAVLNGKPWKPASHTKICSEHFLGGKKSEHPDNPSYIPTIMPAVYKKKPPNLRREVLRRNDSENFNDTAEVTKDQGTQTHMDCLKEHPYNTVLLFASQCQNNVSVQTDIYIASTTYVSTQTDRMTVKATKDTGCGTDDMSPAFEGYASITNDEQMKSIGGVTVETFMFLFSYLQEQHWTKNQLLLFLVKMKLGISFMALGLLFSLHRTSASRIFWGILEVLVKATENMIYWPSKFAVKNTLPACFNKYSEVRVIIDCTELKTERPPKVDQQVLMFSNYKSAYTIKYLIGISPSGFISFLSKGYGGKATDGFITVDSGFLDLIDKGDVIMADKGFPQIEAQLKNKDALLVIPPFAHGSQFSEEECTNTYNIASVRIHVERCIARIKMYNILNKIPVHLFPHIDNIMKMCCVLVNLQTPIIKK